MTISSSLNAGVAGLNANANRLATIADNIANSSTYGYRRAQTDFHAVVAQGNSTVSYAAGGVRTTNMRLIDNSGPLIGTTNATDLAVSGRGFMPVSTIGAISAADPTPPISLVTTGSFRPDANGILRTDTGLVLMGWPANNDGSIGNVPRDSMAGLQPVQLNSNQFVASPTTEMRLGINLPASETRAGETGASHEVLVGYYGNLSTSETIAVTFTPTVPATGASNTWTMTLRDSASNDAVIGEYTLQFDGSQAAGGTLASVTAVSGGTYDATTGTIPLTVGGGTISLDVGKIGMPNGMTQLSDSFAPSDITKNGSPVASLTSVEVDQQGKLYAIYDQGFSRCIYQIPVVDVPNPNGLTALSDQTYEVSSTSGAFYLWDAGDGPTGTVLGFSREESATDVATELTSLIQTQRAYSSNAKVIQTVDEMLQETTNIKR